jgi:hypothetical protein
VGEVPKTRKDSVDRAAVAVRRSTREFPDVYVNRLINVRKI